MLALYGSDDILRIKIAMPQAMQVEFSAGSKAWRLRMWSERPCARAENLRFPEENTVSITARRRYSFPANGRRLRTGSESDLMKVPFEHNDYFVRRLMKNEC